jgi:hypothetical protein
MPCDPEVPVPDPAPWPTPRAASDGAAHLSIVPWPDPFLERDGHDPRSPYAERFWLPTLGPSTYLLHRHLVGGFDRRPEGWALEPVEVSMALGLGPTTSRSAPFGKALIRLVRFRQAEVRPDGDLAVRLHVPPLTLRQVERLPPGLQAEHQRVAATFAELRARRAAASRTPAA